MKILFVYEKLFPPYDEGMKNFAHMIYQALCRSHHVCALKEIPSTSNALNSLLLVPRVITSAFRYGSERVFYLPHSALTFFAFIKIWLLHLILRNRITVIGLQKRPLKKWQKTIVSRMGLPDIFVLSQSMADDLNEIGIQAKTVMAGIDRDRFSPVESKSRLKSEFGIPEDKRILLHVGHIRASRNIEWLMHIQKSIPSIQVLMVGSTTTSQEEALYDRLTSAGVMVIREALPNIEEVYQFSDWYCFPVQSSSAAMEIPLSVLEGMSTNLPIITTRFGRLPELFSESQWYRYVNSWDEIVSLIEKDFGINCENRSMTESFSWDHTARTLIGPEQS